MGHILDRYDLRDNAFISMATGHFVAWLNTSLDGQVHLEHFLHTSRELVSLSKLLLFGFERDIKVFSRLFNAVTQGF